MSVASPASIMHHGGKSIHHEPHGLRTNITIAVSYYLCVPCCLCRHDHNMGIDSPSVQKISYNAFAKNRAWIMNFYASVPRPVSILPDGKYHINYIQIGMHPLWAVVNVARHLQVFKRLAAATMLQEESLNHKLLLTCTPSILWHGEYRLHRNLKTFSCQLGITTSLLFREWKICIYCYIFIYLQRINSIQRCIYCYIILYMDTCYIYLLIIFLKNCKIFVLIFRWIR